MSARVVEEVDSIVKEVTAGNAGLGVDPEGDMAVRKEVRLVLKDKGLHTVPGLFDRAYEYIAGITDGGAQTIPEG